MISEEQPYRQSMISDEYPYTLSTMPQKPTIKN